MVQLLFRGVSREKRQKRLAPDHTQDNARSLGDKIEELCVTARRKHLRELKGASDHDKSKEN
jgi:hypothetical protein